MEENKRLLSLDTLRGFDMMIIMGAAGIVTALCGLFPGGSDCWLARQMEHVKWEGLALMDTVFPLFLFIAGISFPFSYAKQQANGASRGRIYRKIITRGLVLVFFGFVYNGFFNLDLEHLRLCSVLSRIGIAWMFAALIYINFKVGARAVIAAVILVGYWLLMRFCPAPDFPGAGWYSIDGNLAGYVDRMLIPSHLPYIDGLMDPEGILSNVPAIVTAMLGMFTGDFVRISDKKISGGKKTLWMLGAAAVMLAAGLLWSLDFPVIKQLWTSSFVLVVGAYSLAMFAIFYWVIDVKGWKGWTTFFKVVGMNSITIYMAMKIINFRGISKFFLAGIADLCPSPVGKLILSVGNFAICWLFLWFLYKKKVFLKV